MNFILYTYIMLASLFGCDSRLSQPEKEMFEKCEVVQKFVDSELARFRKKYKVNSLGSAISMPGGRLKQLGIIFQIQGPLSLEVLRAMIITYADDFFSSIVSSKELSQILQVSPITIQNIEIKYFMVDRENRYLDAPNIGVVTLANGKIIYKIYDEKTSPSSSVFCETLEEARNKLKQE